MDVFTLVGRIVLDSSGFDTAITNTRTKANSLINVFQRIGVVAAGVFGIRQLKEFGKDVVKTSAEIAAEESAFAQIMTDYADTATTKMGEVAEKTGVVATRLTPYMTSMTAKFKGLGFEIDEATTLASDGLLLATDAAAFWDKSLDDSMGHLNSFLNGSYEGGEAIGLFANDAQMAAYAIENSIVDTTKAWSALDEATKQATRLDYAKQMLEDSGAIGQAAKESESYANTQQNLAESVRQFKGELGTPVTNNLVLPVMQSLNDGFVKLGAFISENEGAISNFTAKIGELVTTGFDKLLQAFQWCIDNGETLKPILATIAGTFAALAIYLNPIPAAILAVGAALTSIVANWNSIKSAINDACDSIREFLGLNNTANGSGVHVSTSGSVHGGGVGKGFASGLDNVPFDGLAYIHEGEAVLNKVNAEAWRSGGYANAGRLEESLNGIQGLLQQFVNRPIVLDSGILVGQIAPALDRQLSIIASRKSRGVKK